MTLTAYEGMGSLPHFNQDLDTESPPAPVIHLREVLRSAQGFLISSPEYAHGMPGSLKNLLDWLVSSGEISHKPIVLINASAGGSEFAQAQLSEVLTVIEGILLPRITLSGPQLRQAFAPDGSITDCEISDAMKQGLLQLASTINGCISSL
jgi:chromate reductase, NAD(P)H dehydrogenase (quinone)